MTYRPYPNVDRALHQVERHYPPAQVIQMPDCLRPMAESFARLRDLQWERAMDGPAWQPGLRLNVGGQS